MRFAVVVVLLSLSRGRRVGQARSDEITDIMGPSLMNGGSRGHHVSLGWVRHDEALTKMAAACWSRDRFTDVTIFCEDRALQAHRYVATKDTCAILPPPPTIHAHHALPLTQP